MSIGGRVGNPATGSLHLKSFVQGRRKAQTTLRWLVPIDGDVPALHFSARLARRHYDASGRVPGVMLGVQRLKVRPRPQGIERAARVATRSLSGVLRPRAALTKGEKDVLTMTDNEQTAPEDAPCTCGYSEHESSPCKTTSHHKSVSTGPSERPNEDPPGVLEEAQLEIARLKYILGSDYADEDFGTALAEAAGLQRIERLEAENERLTAQLSEKDAEFRRVDRERFHNDGLVDAAEDHIETLTAKLAASQEALRDQLCARAATEKVVNAAESWLAWRDGPSNNALVDALAALDKENANEEPAGTIPERLAAAAQVVEDAKKAYADLVKELLPVGCVIECQFLSKQGRVVEYNKRDNSLRVRWDTGWETCIGVEYITDVRPATEEDG